MVLKCCVPLCTSNYRRSGNTGYISVYTLPKDDEEQKLWLSAIPRANLVVTKYTAVCCLHWPNDAELLTLRGGKHRPKNPPSIFPNVSKSCFQIMKEKHELKRLSSVIDRQNSPRKERRTVESLSSVRAIQNDKLQDFLKTDTLIFSSLANTVKEKYNDLFTWEAEDSVIVQSKSLVFGIPKFVINIQKNYTYKCFSHGSRCVIPTLSNKQIKLCATWSILDEIIKILKTKEIDYKTVILLEQLEITGMRKPCWKSKFAI